MKDLGVFDIALLAMALLTLALAIVFEKREGLQQGRWPWSLSALIMSIAVAVCYMANHNPILAEEKVPRKKAVAADPPASPPKRYADPVEQRKFESLWVAATRMSGPAPSINATPVLVETRSGKIVKWEE